MSALSANRTTGRGKVDGTDLAFIINNGSKVYSGGLAMIDDNGLRAATNAVANLRWGGVVIRTPIDATTGAASAGDGTLTATVRRRGTWSFAKSSAAATDLGKMAYVVDDQTVATTLTGVATTSTNTNAYVVGQIVRIIDSSTVEVDMNHRSAAAGSLTLAG